MNEILARAMRPLRFSDVLGQEHSVRYLSGLILRGRLGRNILLHGTVGSGKTTLARIFGKALLCVAPIAGDGSPCGSCDACLKIAACDPDAGFYEYDVGGNGGGAEALDKWWHERRFNARELRRRVLFLDEAHGLEEDAEIIMLKRIEEAQPDVVYILATSEHHNVSTALRSRLIPLRVRALQRGDAAILLRRAAAERRIPYDDAALVTLTNLVAAQPRDLLNALDQLSVYQEPISDETIRRVFDVEHLDALRSYLTALGRRDRVLLNQIVAQWRDPGEEKMRWVLALLAGMYTRDILAVEADVDPVVEQLGLERLQALDKLRDASGVESNFELAPMWRRLLGHWRAELVGASDATIEAQFVAFHDLIAEVGQTDCRLRTARSRSEGPGFSSKSEGADSFMRFSDVTRMLNSASMLTQLHGHHFNALFSVKPSAGAGTRTEQAGLADRFCADLEAMLGHAGTDQFAAIRTVEGGDSGLEARIAAYVPDWIGEDATNGLDIVRQWYRGWVDQRIDVEVSLVTRQPFQKAAKFHWDVVRDLLQALHPSVVAEDWDGATTSLRQLLKLRPADRRDATIAPQPLVVGVGLLADHRVAAEIANGLPVLSAVDDRAWAYVFRDWEDYEFEERKRESTRRQQQLEDLTGQYSDGRRRLEEEERLRSSWSTDPHARPRAWQTWWGR